MKIVKRTLFLLLVGIIVISIKDNVKAASNDVVTLDGKTYKVNVSNEYKENDTDKDTTVSWITIPSDRAAGSRVFLEMDLNLISDYNNQTGIIQISTIKAWLTKLEELYGYFLELNPNPRCEKVVMEMTGVSSQFALAYASLGLEKIVFVKELNKHLFETMQRDYQQQGIINMNGVALHEMAHMFSWTKENLTDNISPFSYGAEYINLMMLDYATDKLLENAPDTEKIFFGTINYVGCCSKALNGTTYKSLAEDEKNEIPYTCFNSYGDAWTFDSNTEDKTKDGIYKRYGEFNPSDPKYSSVIYNSIKILEKIGPEKVKAVFNSYFKGNVSSGDVSTTYKRFYTFMQLVKNNTTSENWTSLADNYNWLYNKFVVSFIGTKKEYDVAVGTTSILDFSYYFEDGQSHPEIIPEYTLSDSSYFSIEDTNYGKGIKGIKATDPTKPITLTITVGNQSMKLKVNVLDQQTQTLDYGYYENTDGTITINQLNCKSKVIIDTLNIPEKINFKTVTGINLSSSSWNNILINAINIPKTINNITYIDQLKNDLHAITVDENNSTYSSKDGVLFNKDKTKLIRFPVKKNSYTYIIPSTVKSIEDSSFDSCDSLVNLTMPDGLEKIGEYSFSGCTSLINLTFPNSLISIGEHAFSGCSGLTGSLRIPSSVTNIGQGAFIDCENIVNINVSSENSFYTSDNGILFTKDKTELMQCPMAKEIVNYVVPNTVKVIDFGAFYKDINLTGTITFPDSLTTIGSGAFQNCSNLTGDLKIPNNVETIAICAFQDCSKLNGKLTLGTKVTTIGQNAFFNCGNLVGNLVIPESVKKIGNYAFYNCLKLEKFVFVGILPTIKNSTFENTKAPIYYIKEAESFDSTNWPTYKMTEFNESLVKNDFLFNSNTTQQIQTGQNLVKVAEISYTSQNIAIAKISQDGTITPVKSGTTNILVDLKYSDSITKTINVSITVDIKAKSVLFTGSSLAITKDTPTKLPSIIVLPENTAIKGVTLKSSNEKIATVNTLGVVTPISRGVCEITATTKDGTNLTTKCIVSVSVQATGVALDKTDYTFDNANSLQLNATVYPSSANQTLNWTSSNTKVAVVTNTGSVIPTGKGTCVITATTVDGTNLSTTCNITSNIEYRKGDINRDGYVNINDVYMAMQGFTKGNLTDMQKTIADVDNNGVFNINDIYKLMQFVVGRIKTLD